MPDATGPVTLGDLVREDKLLWVYCCDCCHERDLNHATVPLPPETPVPELDKRNYLVGAGRTYLGCRQARGRSPESGLVHHVRWCHRRYYRPVFWHRSHRRFW